MAATSDIQQQVFDLLSKTSNLSFVSADRESGGSIGLIPGQKVVAEVLTTLPDSRVQVRIGSERFNLNLPMEVRQGQDLELTFVSGEPRSTFAIARQGVVSPPVTLSDASRLLGLLSSGEQMDNPQLRSSLQSVAGMLRSTPGESGVLANLMDEALTYGAVLRGGADLPREAGGGTPQAGMARDGGTAGPASGPTTPDQVRLAAFEANASQILQQIARNSRFILVEAANQPVVPLLLKPGQEVDAAVQGTLPGGRVFVTVAGSALELTIPRSVTEGELLRLTVISSQPRPVFALSRTVPETAARGDLSEAGRWLSALEYSGGGVSSQQRYVLDRLSTVLKSLPPDSPAFTAILDEAITYRTVMEGGRGSVVQSSDLPILENKLEPVVQNPGRPVMARSGEIADQNPDLPILEGKLEPAVRNPGWTFVEGKGEVVEQITDQTVMAKRGELPVQGAAEGPPATIAQQAALRQGSGIVLGDDLTRLLQALVKGDRLALVEALNEQAVATGFAAGQQLKGDVLAALGGGRFLMRVAEQVFEFSLPKGVFSGDRLTLFFIAADPRPTFLVTRFGRPGDSRLSETGRWLSGFLGAASDGKSVAQPVGILRILLSGLPGDAARVSETLERGVRESGLFYESHLARWFGGDYPLEDILREPQGRLSTLRHPAAAPNPVDDGVGEETVAVAMKDSSLAALETAFKKAGRVADQDGGVDQRSLPVVREQLGTLQSGQILFRGELSAGRPFEWSVSEREAKRGQAGTQERGWDTVLKVDLPRLGAVTARLRLNANRVEVDLLSGSIESVGVLESGREALVEQLRAAGLEPGEIGVHHGPIR